MEKLEKIILPEDVVLKISDKPLFEVRDHNGNVFLTHDERSARYSACTYVHCEAEGCDGIAEKKLLYCPECMEKIRRGRLADAPEWDGEYPVFIGSDEFVDSECRFLRYLDEAQVEDLAHLELRSAEPLMASNIGIDYDDLLAEDCDLPDDVQALVDEFRDKLAKVKAPLSYVADDLLRLSDAQIAYFNKRHKETKGE